MRHAKKVTGIDQVLAVMGGFHLGGAGKETLIQKTIAGLQEIDPTYVVPTHCTGRQAVIAMAQAMPGKVLIKMSGTRMTFAA